MRKKFSILLVVTLILCCIGGCADSSKKESLGDSYNVDKYVTLGDYEKLQGYDIQYEVTKEDVSNEIDSLVNEHASYESIKGRASAKGDYITLNYSTVDLEGNPIDSCSGQELQICIGENEISEDIEEDLVGRKVDDTIVVNTEIPSSFDYESSGKKAQITFSVIKLEEKIYPEYSDDFVKKYTDYDTMEDYEKYLTSYIKSSYEGDYFNQEAARLLNTIVSNSKFTEEYPEELYKECEEEFNETASYFASMYNVDKDTYLTEYESLTEDDIKKQIISTLHQKLVIKAIAKAQSIEPTDDDYSQYIEQMAEDYGYENVDEFKKSYNESTLKFSKLYNDVVDYVRSKADLVTISPDEYNKLFMSDEKDVENNSIEE